MAKNRKNVVKDLIERKDILLTGIFTVATLGLFGILTGTLYQDAANGGFELTTVLTNLGPIEVSIAFVAILATVSIAAGSDVAYKWKYNEREEFLTDGYVWATVGAVVPQFLHVTWPRFADISNGDPLAQTIMFIICIVSMIYIAHRP